MSVYKAIGGRKKATKKGSSSGWGSLGKSSSSSSSSKSSSGGSSSSSSNKSSKSSSSKSYSSSSSKKSSSSKSTSSVAQVVKQALKTGNIKNIKAETTSGGKTVITTSSKKVAKETGAKLAQPQKQQTVPAQQLEKVTDNIDKVVKEGVEKVSNTIPTNVYEAVGGKEKALEKATQSGINKVKVTSSPPSEDIKAAIAKATGVKQKDIYKTSKGYATNIDGKEILLSTNEGKLTIPQEFLSEPQKKQIEKKTGIPAEFITKTDKGYETVVVTESGEKQIVIATPEGKPTVPKGFFDTNKSSKSKQGVPMKETVLNVEGKEVVIKQPVNIKGGALSELDYALQTGSYFGAEEKALEEKKKAEAKTVAKLAELYANEGLITKEEAQSIKMLAEVNPKEAAAVITTSQMSFANPKVKEKAEKMISKGETVYTLADKQGVIIEAGGKKDIEKKQIEIIKEETKKELEKKGLNVPEEVITEYAKRVSTENVTIADVAEEYLEAKEQYGSNEPLQILRGIGAGATGYFVGPVQDIGKGVFNVDVTKEISKLGANEKLLDTAILASSKYFDFGMVPRVDKQLANESAFTKGMGIGNILGISFDVATLVPTTIFAKGAVQAAKAPKIIESTKIESSLLPKGLAGRATITTAQKMKTSDVFKSIFKIPQKDVTYVESQKPFHEITSEKFLFGKPLVKDVGVGERIKLPTLDIAQSFKKGKGYQLDEADILYKPGIGRKGEPKAIIKPPEDYVSDFMRMIDKESDALSLVRRNVKTPKSKTGNTSLKTRSTSFKDRPTRNRIAKTVTKDKEPTTLKEITNVSKRGQTKLITRVTAKDLGEYMVKLPKSPKRIVTVPKGRLMVPPPMGISRIDVPIPNFNLSEFTNNILTTAQQPKLGVTIQERFEDRNKRHDITKQFTKPKHDTTFRTFNTPKESNTPRFGRDQDLRLTDGLKMDTTTTPTTKPTTTPSSGGKFDTVLDVPQVNRIETMPNQLLGDLFTPMIPRPIDDGIKNKKRKRSGLGYLLERRIGDIL